MSKIKVLILDDVESSLNPKLGFFGGCTALSPSLMKILEAGIVEPISKPDVVISDVNFLDFAFDKIANNTVDGGKSIFGSKAAQYFGMLSSIEDEEKFFGAHIRVTPSNFDSTFGFNSPIAHSESNELQSWKPALISPILSQIPSTNYSYTGTYFRNYCASHASSKDYDTIWEAIRQDEELMALLIELIKNRYKVIKRLYFEKFHSHKQEHSITYDLSKYYEYFDLITTLRKGSEFVQTSTNSVKMAETSRKPFIKNGKFFKLKKYPIAA